VTVQPFDYLRAAERPHVNIGEKIRLRIIWYRGSEVFQSKDSDVAGHVLYLHSERISIVGFQPLCCLGHARLVFGCQDFEQTHSPEAFEFTHLPFAIERESVIVSKSS
jgi:hypothetical protein